MLAVFTESQASTAPSFYKLQSSDPQVTYIILHAHADANPTNVGVLVSRRIGAQAALPQRMCQVPVNEASLLDRFRNARSSEVRNHVHTHGMAPVEEWVCGNIIGFSDESRAEIANILDEYGTWYSSKLATPVTRAYAYACAIHEYTCTIELYPYDDPRNSDIHGDLPDELRRSINAFRYGHPTLHILARRVSFGVAAPSAHSTYHFHFRTRDAPTCEMELPIDREGDSVVLNTDMSVYSSKQNMQQICVNLARPYPNTRIQVQMPAQGNSQTLSILHDMFITGDHTDLVMMVNPNLFPSLGATQYVRSTKPTGVSITAKIHIMHYTIDTQQILSYHRSHIMLYFCPISEAGPAYPIAAPTQGVVPVGTVQFTLTNKVLRDVGISDQTGIYLHRMCKYICDAHASHVVDFNKLLTDYIPQSQKLVPMRCTYQWVHPVRAVFLWMLQTKNPQEISALKIWDDNTALRRTACELCASPAYDEYVRKHGIAEAVPVMRGALERNFELLSRALNEWHTKSVAPVPLNTVSEADLPTISWLHRNVMRMFMQFATRGRRTRPTRALSAFANLIVAVRTIQTEHVLPTFTTTLCSVILECLHVIETLTCMQFCHSEIVESFVTIMINRLIQTMRMHMETPNQVEIAPAIARTGVILAGFDVASFWSAYCAGNDSCTLDALATYIYAHNNCGAPYVETRESVVHTIRTITDAQYDTSPDVFNWLQSVSSDFRGYKFVEIHRNRFDMLLMRFGPVARLGSNLAHAYVIGRGRYVPWFDMARAAKVAHHINVPNEELNRCAASELQTVDSILIAQCRNAPDNEKNQVPLMHIVHNDPTHPCYMYVSYVSQFDTLTRVDRVRVEHGHAGYHVHSMNIVFPTIAELVRYVTARHMISPPPLPAPSPVTNTEPLPDLDEAEDEPPGLVDSEDEDDEPPGLVDSEDEDPGDAS